MEKEVAQFELKDGTTFLVEVDEPERRGVERVSTGTNRMVLKAQQTLDDALDQVKPVASTVLSKLKTGLTAPADDIEVKFGLKLSTDAGIIFSTVGGEVNFEVTLKWNRESDSAGA